MSELSFVESMICICISQAFSVFSFNLQPLKSVQLFTFILYTMTWKCTRMCACVLSCFSSVQFSSFAQSYSTLCDPMNHSTPSLPVHHQLPEFTQTHTHRVSDAIQPSHPRSSSFPPSPNPFQHQSLFQWVNSSHEVAKVLEFQL